jgi:hypothetical protein
MPRIAFSGVRISWLMLATNVDFARVADSAACSARRSSAVRSFTSCSSRSAFSANRCSRSWITCRSALKASTSAPTSSSAPLCARSVQFSLLRTALVVSTRLAIGRSRRVSSQWAARPTAIMVNSALMPSPPRYSCRRTRIGAPDARSSTVPWRGSPLTSRYGSDASSTQSSCGGVAASAWAGSAVVSPAAANRRPSPV